MKKPLLLLLGVLSYAITFGQLNMQLLSKVTYNEDLNDVWGWVDEDTGVEYAIVGLRNGTSIVSLEDPSNATELFYIPGPSSTWRDIKTWGEFAYVTNETAEGVLVIDLSGLPDNIDHYNWTPTENEIGGTLSSCHNLYIDENGICYLAGCNLNNGGVINVDVATNVGQPEIVGWGPPEYSHDVYARDNLLYSSEIYLGVFAIYDVDDPANPVFIASQQTPFNFTHNTWLSDDGRTIFTTDERANAPVAAYDISDFNNIEYLDEYRPVATIGEDVIPHNVHVWNDWLIISYYTDGGIVVDASRPENLIEVGNFDSFFSPGAGFNGAWGAYPFLPSQTVLISDINSGLYVLQPNYVRACWLEGQVTEKGSGAPIENVEVIIDSSQPNIGGTDFNGNYETGQAIPGTFDVTFSKYGYQSKTVATSLENGTVTQLDVELEASVPFTLSGIVVDAATGEPIPNALVGLKSNQVSQQSVSDINGNFLVPNFFEDDYEIFGGKWGYDYASLSQSVDANTNLVIRLEKRYVDQFVFDYNWETTIDGATAGFWERGVPNGTSLGGGILANPNADVAGDNGEQAYVTGNDGGNVGRDDVDDGFVFLTSPPMELSNYNNPYLTFQYWFVNGGGNSPANDNFLVEVTNGLDTVVILDTDQSISSWIPSDTFYLEDYIQVNDEVRVIFSTGDLPTNGHIVEAGVDDFRVEGEKTVNNEEIFAGFELNAFPNPYTSFFTMSLQGKFDGQIIATNALGQIVYQQDTQGQEQIELGTNWENGIYTIQLVAESETIQQLKVIKQ
jgi:choice-of-anchor B domain-containing protein